MANQEACELWIEQEIQSGQERGVTLSPVAGETFFEQAKARIESGAACSVSEAARQLGDETGKNPESIRQRILEEQRNTTVHPVQLSDLAGTDKHRPPDNSHFRTSFTGDNEWYTPVEYVEAAREVDRRVAEYNSFYELHLCHG